ncbi:hypothetical protein AAFF27_18920 [Xylophilus sp. GW821-FHT01B05]
MPLNVTLVDLPSADVLVYKFGCRIDATCAELVEKQILLSRRLYNDLIADIRLACDKRFGREMELAGAEGGTLQQQVDRLTQEFRAARADNDASKMTALAAERRNAWAQLSTLLRQLRASHKAELNAYLSGIGRSSDCSTYAIRTRYVVEGLGWATANRVLDSALRAFNSTMKRGQAPRFAKADETTHDALRLQFTAAGGVPAETLLLGKNREFKLTMPAEGGGRRRYASYAMRMGAASNDMWATGTCQIHREFPKGVHIAAISLVRERVANSYKWHLHFLLKTPVPVEVPIVSPRLPLAVLHLGWSADAEGRRVGASADSPEPGAARVLQLPAQIESRFGRSSELQAERFRARDQVVTELKARAVSVASTWPENAAAEFAALHTLLPQHVAPSRLHRIWWLLHHGEALKADLAFFSAWRAADRLAHQAYVGIARTARMQRRDFYRALALEQCLAYECLVVDVPDLARAATIVDEVTGKKNTLGRTARSGRFTVALHEYEAALKWAAVRCKTVLLDVSGATSSSCCVCGQEALHVVEGSRFQQVRCSQCGTVHDRKCNAATSIYRQVSGATTNAMVEKAAVLRAQGLERKEQERRTRLSKIQASRRTRLLAAMARVDGLDKPQ